jgi:hypothetical protein
MLWGLFFLFLVFFFFFFIRYRWQHVIIIVTLKWEQAANSFFIVIGEVLDTLNFASDFDQLLKCAFEILLLVSDEIVLHYQIVEFEDTFYMFQQILLRNLQNILLNLLQIALVCLHEINWLIVVIQHVEHIERCQKQNELNLHGLALFLVNECWQVQSDKLMWYLHVFQLF